jgi:GNAT superfamily N-acetyltransferase
MWPLRPPRTHHANENENKAAMRDLLDAGDSPGLIALVEDRAVGWCALGPRERYPQYERASDERGIWAIPCLYVAPSADKSTIARALIEAAVEQARLNAASVVAGPPPWWLPGDAAAIIKATELFVANGFAIAGPGARMPQLERRLFSDRR